MNSRRLYAILSTVDEPQALLEIISILRCRAGCDFGGYKKPMLLRRIQRRRGICRLPQIEDYVNLLRKSAAEAAALADDLMIPVTGFFRDPEAWEALREKVVQPLIARRASGEAIRAWVAACSTGEEACTLGMVLLEAAAAAGKKFRIAILATDWHARSLALARLGAYPHGIERDVSADRLARFFDRDDSAYRAKPVLRDTISFAAQNILEDAPPEGQDLCCCRNLLIYLEREAQQRVLARLRGSLRAGGALFLGAAESVSSTTAGFEPIDQKWRIHRRQAVGGDPTGR